MFIGKKHTTGQVNTLNKLKTIALFLILFSTCLFGGETIIEDKKDFVIELLKREKIVSITLSLKGIDYMPGGDNVHDGFDCSGLTQYVYYQAGIKIPRTSGAQFTKAVKINSVSVKKGDLVFFSTMFFGVNHVGIYIGNGRFIHAPRIGKPVKIDSMSKKYWKQRYVGAGRYL